MSRNRARWYAGSILGAAGAGALLGLAYFSQTFSLRLTAAIVSAVAVFFASAFAIFAIFRTAIRIGFLPILAVAGGLGGLVFSFISRSSLPWSILLGFAIGLAAPGLYLLTSKIFRPAGTKESE
jgi:hypothetical protein